MRIHAELKKEMDFLSGEKNVKKKFFFSKKKKNTKNFQFFFFLAKNVPFFAMSAPRSSRGQHRCARWRADGARTPPALALGDAALNRQIVHRMRIPLSSVTTEEELAAARGELAECITLGVSLAGAFPS